MRCIALGLFYYRKHYLAIWKTEYIYINVKWVWWAEILLTHCCTVVGKMLWLVLFFLHWINYVATASISKDPCEIGYRDNPWLYTVSVSIEAVVLCMHFMHYSNHFWLKKLLHQEIREACVESVEDKLLGDISKSGVGVTKAPFVNFSVSKIFDAVKVPVRLFASHSYLTGVTAAELRQHQSNLNVIYKFTIANMYFGDAEKLGK